MKVHKHIAAYRRMRSQPLWRLLASANGPTVIALLQSQLYDKERRLAASILFERLTRDLETLRAQGDDFPQTAQAYVANWLGDGYLERRFPPGASEEEYELSSAAVEAIRFLSALAEPHSAATESRLSLVIQALAGLAEDTDADQPRRIERLRAEQARIDRDIEAIQKGRMRVLPRATALERTREIISLADDLTGDFRRVRDQFEQLNRDLRERIMDSEGNRGEVLDALFAGIDLIAESEAGRTFSKYFVQSREYLEQRRLNQLLKEAQRSALAIKDQVKATETLPYALQLSSSRLRSLSQWALYDPTLQAAPEAMREGEAPPVDLQSVSELVAQSEIDFRSLKAQVCALLEHRDQASIGEVLERFPAAQGLGSVLGLLALGSRHGIKGADNAGEEHREAHREGPGDNIETVAWVGAGPAVSGRSWPRPAWPRRCATSWAAMSTACPGTRRWCSTRLLTRPTTSSPLWP